MAIDLSNPVERLAEGRLSLGPSGKGLVPVTIAAEVRLRFTNDFDEQRKQGANRSRPVFRGCKPAGIRVEFVVLDEDEEAFWRDVAPMLKPRSARGRAEPLDIENPTINRMGVNTVVVRDVDIGTPSARDGRDVRIEFGQWGDIVEPETEKSRRERAEPPGIGTDQVFSNAQ